MTLISNLPLDILYRIRSYLTHDDFHYLLNASKLSFQDLKRRLIVLNLTPKKTVEYLTDALFREKVLKVVENGWKQVNVSLIDGLFDVSSLSSDIPIHQLSRKLFHFAESYETTPLQTLAHIERLAGIRCDGSIPSLLGVKELEIIQVDGELSDESNLSHLERLDMSDARLLAAHLIAFRDISDLSLQRCTMVEDFSVFHHSRQRSLALTHCPHLVSVESFRMIRHLELKECDHLEDVSPLRGIYSLVLHDCPKVRDISVLGGHHRLSLAHCDESMIGYDSLLNIPHVFLTASNIVDASVLRAATSVYLYRCYALIDVSPLAHVKRVEIRMCSLVKDVSSLKSNDSLTFVSPSFESSLKQDQLSQLKNRKLHLEGYGLSPSSFSFLQSEVNDLTLRANGQFTDLLYEEVNDLPDYFRNLHSLSLDSLEIEDVKGLGDIPSLRLRKCSSLVDVTALGRNHCVEIIECHFLEDVRSLSTVPVVKIIQCFKIQDYTGSGLDNVPRLKIVFSQAGC